MEEARDFNQVMVSVYKSQVRTTGDLNHRFVVKWKTIKQTKTKTKLLGKMGKQEYPKLTSSQGYN